MYRFDNLSLLFFFFFFFLLLSLPPLTTSSTSRLIKLTCNYTTSYAFCISTLESDSDSFTACTTKDLSTIAIKIVLSSAVNTSSYMFSLAKKVSYDARLGSVLRGCGQRYVNACEALEWGLAAVEAENYDYAAVHMGAGKEYPEMCRGLFRAGASSSRLSYPKEVARREWEPEGLCQLALDIVSCLLN